MMIISYLGDCGCESAHDTFIYSSAPRVQDTNPRKWKISVMITGSAERDLLGQVNLSCPL